MADHDAFRQDLSTSLRHGAELRRAWFADLSDGPTGEDIKIIALFERLAAEVLPIDVDVFRRCGMLRHEHVARRFLQRRDVLLAQLGVTYVPTWCGGWTGRPSHAIRSRTATALRPAVPSASPDPVAAVAEAARRVTGSATFSPPIFARASGSWRRCSPCGRSGKVSGNGVTA